MTCLFLLALTHLHAQEDRFLNTVFDEVQVTSDLVYSVNSTVLLLPIVGEAIEAPIPFDFYEPAGDSLAERPLVLLLHTGNFLPQVINGGVLGEKTDSSNVEIATRLAKMGYVVAALDYRLGWNPTAPTQPERALGLIQAAYRGVQDTRTAIRYFKRDYAENGNSFGVDTSRITVWGVGTGGYISLGTAYLGEYTDIINTTNPPAKFLLDLDGDEAPETPMVIPDFHGDIYGTTLGMLGEDGLSPFPPFDTLNLPNYVGYSSDFQLVVNVAGALGDISWIDEQSTIPLISFQAPSDPFAPYDDDVLIVPTTGDRIVQVQGAQAIATKISELGINQVFVDAGIDDAFTQRAMAASAEAGHDYFEGLFPVIRGLNPLGNMEGDPWQWWDAEFWSTQIADSTRNINWDQASRINNFDASPEKGRIYIDTLIGYFAPRAFAALDLEGLLTSNEVLLSSTEVGLSIAPNPAIGFTNIETNREYPIEHLNIYDMQGRQIRSFANINQNFFRLNREGIPDGIYVAKLKFKEGILTQKIIFN